MRAVYSSHLCIQWKFFFNWVEGIVNNIELAFVQKRWTLFSFWTDQIILKKWYDIEIDKALVEVSFDWYIQTL